MGPSIPTPDPAVVRAHLARRVHVVAGKGGVGRTTIAAGLAHKLARAGYRTLLLEVDAPDDAARAMGVQPAVDSPREAFNNLWLCRMTPTGSMKEYALLVLKFKALYNLVFENRLVKYLLRSIPSLGEFTMSGKAWYHAEERREDGALKYERIVIDAPATGHAITFLSVARTVANVAPKGVMRDFAEKMAALLESPNDACLHVVCLPEEMPVNEGLDVLKMGVERVRMRPGLGFVNRVLEERFDAEALEVIARLPEAMAPFASVAQLRSDRERWQSEHAERFAEDSALPTLVVPDVAQTTPDGRFDLDTVVSILDEAAGESPTQEAQGG
ncbi:MAG: ArsA-related P-loop ATPase [Deltaproteobacteria bacterium]